MAQKSRENFDSKIFKTPPAPEPPTAPKPEQTIVNSPSGLKVVTPRFPAMPVEQEDPNLPRLKSQSPPLNPPQASPAPTPPAQSKTNFVSLFLNKMTLFLVIVILFFFLSAGLILAYTGYNLYQPPEPIRNFFDALLRLIPLPKP